MEHLLPRREEEHGEGARLPRPPPALNRHLRYEHFKVEGLHTVRDLLRRRDYMAKVDLSDYFFHLPIKPEER